MSDGVSPIGLEPIDQKGHGFWVCCVYQFHQGDIRKGLEKNEQKYVLKHAQCNTRAHGFKAKGSCVHVVSYNIVETFNKVNDYQGNTKNEKEGRKVIRKYI